eukprot:scaffold330500_cov59-Tisochrysis_lutea.AAC.2
MARHLFGAANLLRRRRLRALNCWCHRQMLGRYVPASRSIKQASRRSPRALPTRSSNHDVGVSEMPSIRETAWDICLVDDKRVLARPIRASAPIRTQTAVFGRIAPGYGLCYQNHVGSYLSTIRGHAATQNP